MPAKRIYNPPPNWPRPPSGFQPPDDWEPDPDWGPAPDGWQVFQVPAKHEWLLRMVLTVIILGLLVILTTAGFAVLNALVDDGDEPETSQQKRPPGDQAVIQSAKQAARDGRSGTYTATEADCMVDGLMRRGDFSLPDISRYFSQPSTPTAFEAAEVAVLRDCFEPSAVVEPRPLTPEARADLASDLRQNIADLAEAESLCIIDGMFANGVTMRQLMASEFHEPARSAVESSTLRAAEVCLQ